MAVHRVGAGNGLWEVVFVAVHSSQPKNWFITLLWGPRGILNMADTGQQKPLPGAGYPALLRVMGRMSVSLSTAAQVSREEEELVQILNDCDDALVLLLNERAKALEALWKARGPEEGIPSAALSEASLERLKATNEAVGGPLPDGSIRNIFQEVSKMCSQLRHSVSYLGPPATFSHQVRFFYLLRRLHDSRC
eukprot:2822239-Rhodomonas_salina.1